MFENITQQQLMLLIRALNSERNVIQHEIDMHGPQQEMRIQRLQIEALYNEAENHPLNQRTFGDRMRDVDDPQFDVDEPERSTSDIRALYQHGPYTNG